MWCYPLKLNDLSKLMNKAFFTGTRRREIDWKDDVGMPLENRLLTCHKSVKIMLITWQKRYYQSEALSKCNALLFGYTIQWLV